MNMVIRKEGVKVSGNTRKREEDIKQERKVEGRWEEGKQGRGG